MPAPGGAGGLAYATEIVVTHDYGTSPPRTDDLTRLRSWHLGFSRVYVIGKHRGRLAPVLSMFHPVGRFLSPEMFSARERLKAQAFLAGTRAVLSAAVMGEEGFLHEAGWIDSYGASWQKGRKQCAR